MQATSALSRRAPSSAAAAFARARAKGPATGARTPQARPPPAKARAQNTGPATKLAPAPMSAIKAMTAAAFAISSPRYVGPQLGRIRLGIVGGELGGFVDDVAHLAVDLLQRVLVGQLVLQDAIAHLLDRIMLAANFLHL